MIKDKEKQQNIINNGEVKKIKTGMILADTGQEKKKKKSEEEEEKRTNERRIR